MRRAAAGESGLSFVEQLITVALIAIIGVALLYGLSGGTLGVGVVDEQVAASNAATSALEAVKRTSFVTGTASYSPAVALPQGYQVSIAASTVVTGLQWVTATVTHNGRTVVQVADYKTNR